MRYPAISFTCASLSVLCLSVSALAYSGGTGEPNTPYQIASVADWDTLIATPTDWDGKYFIQTADIDFGGSPKSAIGYYDGTNKNAFNSVYDGQNHTLSNGNPVRHARDPYNVFGIFGVVGTGRLANIRVVNVTINRDSSAKDRPSFVGGLAGWANSTTVSITDCSVTGSIVYSHATTNSCSFYVGMVVGLFKGAATGCTAVGSIAVSETCTTPGVVTCIGGLFGQVIADADAISSITDCIAEVDITGTPTLNAATTRVGGVTGDIEDNEMVRRSTMTNCHWAGTINIANDADTRMRVGGIAGRTQLSDLLRCSAVGTITVNCPTSASNDTNGHPALCVGGGAGFSAGTLTASYVDCDISVGYETSACVGGLIGDIYYGNAATTNCYAEGSFYDLVENSTNVNFPSGCGGLIGRAVYTTFTSCFSAMDAFSAKAGNAVSHPAIGVKGERGEAPTLTACYWDRYINNWGADSTGLIGKTTAEMQDPSTFILAGWDLTSESANGTNDIWRMCADGVDYPRLALEYVRAGDLACPDGVAFDDLARFADDWLLTYSAPLYGADATGDRTVDFMDFAVLATAWQEGI